MRLVRTNKDRKGGPAGLGRSDDAVWTFAANFSIAAMRQAPPPAVKGERAASSSSLPRTPGDMFVIGQPAGHPVALSRERGGDQLTCREEGALTCS